MKPIALAVALAVSFRWCGAAPAADVKVHAVITVEGSHMLMFTAVYRADASKQTVLWWVEGVPDSQTALEKCNVVDALNWRCEGSETASGSAMVNGRYGKFGVVDPAGFKFLTESEWKTLQANQG